MEPQHGPASIPARSHPIVAANAALEAPLDFGRSLEAIGLEELNAAAALQVRIDRKYVVPLQLAARVLGGLEESPRILQIGGLRSFGYHSVYFDTPERTSFLAAATGRRRRFKIRTRSYLDTGATFLEVKTEGARAATVKERIEYNPQHRARLTAEGIEYVTEALTHTLGGELPIDPLRLRPVIATDYRRTTLFLPESNSRATIDEDLSWRTPDARGVRLTRCVVIETKSGSRPGAVDRLLWAHRVRPAKMSKFATGLAALDPSLPSNKWHRTLNGPLDLLPFSAARVA